MAWIRITGIVLLIVGLFFLFLRRKRSPDRESASAGDLSDASGLYVPTDHRHHHHHHHGDHGAHAGHDGGFDGGSGGDGGGSDGGSH